MTAASKDVHNRTEFESAAVAVARAELCAAVANFPEDLQVRVMRAAGAYSAAMVIDMALRLGLAAQATNSRAQ